MTRLLRPPVAGWRVTFRRMTARDVVALAHVALVAVYLEVLVRVAPLRTLVRAAGLTLRTDPTVHTVAPPLLTDAEGRRLRWARMVARRWPLGTGPCLRRSLLLGHVLRRVHPVLRIGVARTAGGISAHAWLEVPGALSFGGADHVAFDLGRGEPAVVAES